MERKRDVNEMMSLTDRNTMIETGLTDKTLYLHLGIKLHILRRDIKQNQTAWTVAEAAGKAIKRY